MSFPWLRNRRLGVSKSTLVSCTRLLCTRKPWSRRVRRIFSNLSGRRSLISISNFTVGGPAFYENRTAAAPTSRKKCLRPVEHAQGPLYWRYGGSGQTGGSTQTRLEN